MRQFLLCIAFLVVLPVSGFAQLDQKQFRKEVPAFERAINGIAEAVLPGYGLREAARAAYIEGCGPVFFVEVLLERAANPFFTPGSPAEVKQNMERRLKETKVKMTDLLKTKFSDLTAASDSGSLTVVVNVVNSNPLYAPTVPTQVVFIARRKLTDVDVAVHEYNLDTTAR